VSLVLALLLDAALGEPRTLWDRWPHPAVLMGRAVAWADRRFNDRTRAKGVLALAILLAGAIALGLVLAALPGAIAEVVVGAVLLAQRSLADHVSAVARALRLSLPEGRRAVAMIVGRDTATMDESATARAAIESVRRELLGRRRRPRLLVRARGPPRPSRLQARQHRRQP
jgi:adenosylcobinamide-phosphate synthase